MYQLAVKSHFCAAHHLRGHPTCGTTHGHTFFYEICLSGEKLDKLGMLVDFVEVKSVLKVLETDWLDHTNLNDKTPFQKVNPTAENLSSFIYKYLKNIFINYMGIGVVEVKSVTVWESPECAVTYSEE